MHTIMLFCSVSDQHSYLLSFVYRKVGQLKTWNKNLPRYCQLWIAHELQFPHIRYAFPPSTVYDAYRAWCFSRGGFQSSFPDTVAEVLPPVPIMLMSPFFFTMFLISQIASSLKTLEIPHTVNLTLDLPYVIDIAFGECRMLSEFLFPLFITIKTPCGHTCRVQTLRLAGHYALRG